jgi:LacI family transcriptional regulator
MQVKLKDIAHKTGYSITTVSRALAGYDDVNHETRQQIIAVANSLGYQPNQLARQLRSQRSYTIGMIIPVDDHSFSDDFFTQLILGIGNAASHERYDLLISSQPASSQEEMEAYRRIVGGHRVDGIIVARTRCNDTRIVYLQQRRHPFVVSGRNAPGERSDFPYIDVDSEAGIYLATQHFTELGHRHIGLILPPRDIAFTEYRHTGYRDALVQAGIAYRPEYVLYGNLLRSGGYHGARDLLDHHPELTAIVACNDLMALGAMSAIQGRGLRVGQDIAVSGFDDIPAAEYAHPSLTTIRQPIYEIGLQLTQMLVALIAGQSLLESQLILKPTLVSRESSGLARS